MHADRSLCASRNQAPRDCGARDTPGGANHTCFFWGCLRKFCFLHMLQKKKRLLFVLDDSPSHVQYNCPLRLIERIS